MNDLQNFWFLFAITLFIGCGSDAEIAKDNYGAGGVGTANSSGQAGTAGEQTSGYGGQEAGSGGVAGEDGSAGMAGNVSGGSGGADCSYQSSPTYPSFISSAPYSCPGGIVMTISGQLDASGNLTVYARKMDGNAFGDGSYSVRVFDPNDPVDQQCKSFNVLKTSNPSGIGSDQLTFSPFPSLLVCGGAGKAYCITKEGGDNPAHFCSSKLVVSYELTHLIRSSFD